MDAMYYLEKSMRSVKSPREVTLRSKSVLTPLFISPSCAGPMILWYASSLSKKLHGRGVFSLSLMTDENSASGLKLSDFCDDFDKNEAGSLVSSLMVLSYATEQVLAPALKVPSFDYESLLVSFRVAIEKNYAPNKKISADDPFIGSVVEKELFSPLRQEGALFKDPTPSILGGRNA